MNLTRTLNIVGLVTLATITSPLAVGAESGWYGGVSIGDSSTAIDDTKITNSMLEGGFNTISINDKNQGNGYKLFGGYQLNKNFALEGGYFNLGKFGFSATTLPVGTLSSNIIFQGLNLDAVGILPLTEKLSAIGRAGLAYTEARNTITGTGFVNVLDPNPHKTDTNYKLGLGFQYHFTDSLGMRIEAERYRVNDAVDNKGDVDLVSIGFVYRFGGKTEVPAPRMVASTQVTFSAKSFFAFDKATVKPAGKKALDEFAAKLIGTTFKTITVTGHTDRINSYAYNMKLSTRRAEAIKTYLEAAGIPADKIIASGVAQADPVTKPGECRGKKKTKELILCLQPDRRVTIEVAGSE